MVLVKVKKNPGNSHCGSNKHILSYKSFLPQTAVVYDRLNDKETLFCLFSPWEADSLMKLLVVHGFMRKQTTPLKKCKIGPNYFNYEHEKC